MQQVTVNTCNEKTQWLEANPDATTNDFIQQRKDFEDSLAPIWAKLLEPPSKYSLFCNDLDGRAVCHSSKFQANRGTTSKLYEPKNRTLKNYITALH